MRILVRFNTKIIRLFHLFKVPQKHTRQVGGQAVLGRQDASPTPWLTERHGYDPTCRLPLSTFIY